MKGPIANAGSIPTLFNKSGINVPIKDAVSYTHLDVYKRQLFLGDFCTNLWFVVGYRF